MLLVSEVRGRYIEKDIASIREERRKTDALLREQAVTWEIRTKNLAEENDAVALTVERLTGELHKTLRPHLGEMREGYIETVRHSIRNGIENSAKTRNATAA